MDYAREGGYFYPKESGMDKDEEEEIREVVVHEKGRSTVGVFFSRFPWFLVASHPHLPSFGRSLPVRSLPRNRQRERRAAFSMG